MKTNVKPAKFEYVNAVRGIAILLVIILHVSRATIAGLPDAFSYMCAKGAFGVQLFFIASAFTLFLSYTNRSKEDCEYTKHNFFIRRIFRISPMYYIAALAYGIVCYYIPAYNDGKPLVVWKVIANVLYVNEFIPGSINYLPPGGWSVGVEMVFYCCLPYLFTKIKNIKSAIKWFTMLAIGTFLLKLVIRYILIRLSINYHNPENWFLYFWFPNQVSIFFLGIILYFAIQKYKLKSKLVSYAGFTLSTLLLLIIMYNMRTIDPHYIIPEHIIVAIFFTFNIFFLSQHSIILFNNKITRFLGEISFSLYLVHFLVIDFLATYCPLPDNPMARFFTLLGITIVVSGTISKITYHNIELKGIKWGNKFVKRKQVQYELDPAL